MDNIRDQNGENKEKLNGNLEKLDEKIDSKDLNE